MNAEIRQEMNDEDEYFSAIEMRDTQLMELKQVVSQRDQQINQQNQQINRQSQQIKAMATAMLQNGMSIDTIARTIGKTTDEVKALLEE